MDELILRGWMDMIVKPRQCGGPGPLGAVAPWEEDDEMWIGAWMYDFVNQSMNEHMD